MMMHFLGEIDAGLEAKLAAYLRARQADHDGWPLYHGGDFNISCSVKAYFALKLAGDSPGSAHMARARAAILHHGGAAAANVFTRIALALFGQLPWRGVPYVPVEFVLLPRWFPINIHKVSYWSRTVMVPLTILCTKTARPQSPPGADPRVVHDATGCGTSLLSPSRRTPHPAGAHLPDPRPARPRCRSLGSRIAARACPAAGRSLGARAAEWRGRPGRHLPGHGECPRGARGAGVTPPMTRAGSPRKRPWSNCWSSVPRAPTASRAPHRSGIPGSPRSPCRR